MPTSTTRQPEAAGTALASSPGREGAKIERAYQQLKQDIVAGRYSPNERLVEAPLTQSLGVSRNTLRAVLARLEQEGLVVLEPNRGGRVRSFSLEEAQELLRMREVLEGLVARLAAERATKEQRAGLRSALEATERALADDDLMRYSALNREFHALLIAAALSPQAAAVLDSLHFPLAKFQFQVVLLPGRKQENLDEHRDLLRAIEKADGESAEQAARAHIRHIREALARC